MSSFIESFISSGKQGGRARVLGEGCDIEEKQLSCISLSCSLLWLGLCQISAYRLLDINILGKAAVLHLNLTQFCCWSCAKLSLQNTEYNCAYVLIGFSCSTPHRKPQCLCLICQERELNPETQFWGNGSISIQIAAVPMWTRTLTNNFKKSIVLKTCVAKKIHTTLKIM
jgi:hypothetical protein